MPKPKKAPPRLSFRVDVDLVDRVHEYADKNNITVSEACRMILRMALGDEASRAVATETIYTFQALRHRAVRRLAAEMQEMFPTILDQELEALHDKA